MRAKIADGEIKTRGINWGPHPLELIAVKPPYILFKQRGYTGWNGVGSTKFYPTEYHLYKLKEEKDSGFHYYEGVIGIEPGRKYKQCKELMLKAMDDLASGEWVDWLQIQIDLGIIDLGKFYNDKKNRVGALRDALVFYAHSFVGENWTIESKDVNFVRYERYQFTLQDEDKDREAVIGELYFGIYVKPSEPMISFKNGPTLPAADPDCERAFSDRIDKIIQQWKVEDAPVEDKIAKDIRRVLRKWKQEGYINIQINGSSDIKITV